MIFNKVSLNLSEIHAYTIAVFLRYKFTLKNEINVFQKTDEKYGVRVIISVPRRLKIGTLQAHHKKQRAHSASYVKKVRRLN